MRVIVSFFALLLLSAVRPGAAQDIKTTPLYQRIKASLDAVPAIDTHDHLRAFQEMPVRDHTPSGPRLTLHGVWRGSYYPWTNPLTAWPASGNFDEWWSVARHDFDNARATSFYRYMLPAFRDLYGVDFDTLTEHQARELNQKIVDNDRDDAWLNDVITRRANIELMLIDPYWARLRFPREFRFSVPVLNVTNLMSGSHADRFAQAVDSPYAFAASRQREISTLDDYLAVLDLIFEEAVAQGCVCLKSTQAYSRTLRYEDIPRTRAAEVFGQTPSQCTPQDPQDFEDFMFRHVCRLSAKHELPFQVHTGQARVQVSNPMLLVDAIAAHPDTKFVLFHGGYPWVGETAVIAMRHPNVWIDSVWLPTLSYTMAKRAYQEWLEAVPSDRMLWGADTVTAEGIYAATEFTRQCLAEALAEKVARGELREEHALRIGRQVLRENALKLFPTLQRFLWREDAAARGDAS